ncbi:MAG: RNA polymerase factor sigma-54 [Bacteroidales bacterium]|nr:RNA polymerase factor sigma-54 [Bacteroidales bacterium]MBR4805544.1 RNA polymerase factor sigma-54 [Bacteroidales bacterium]MBR4980156.1 RNA polymerase factor sigma-54 [Bacteroidales bacterium]MBR5907555.1 RNA polymerase factor sigma-54 [Bacteroidales bacterium]
MAKQSSKTGLGIGQTTAQIQTLTPIQIQTIKLLELPLVELEQKIQKEIEENPVLEDPEESQKDENPEERKKLSLSEVKDDTIPSYKLYVNNRGKDERPQYNTFSVKESLYQSLLDQLGYRKMDERRRKLASFIICSLDLSGYLTRDLSSLENDIYLRLGIETSVEELEKILTEDIQQLDPVGVGARNTKECLVLQLKAKENRTPAVEHAQQILESYYEEFTKKHFEKIMARLNITEEEIKEAYDVIRKLNLHPGGQVDDSYTDQTMQIVPDFILENEDGKLVVTLPKFNMPQIKVSKDYQKYLEKKPGASKAEKEASSFVKSKYDGAKWFIEAINRRQDTMQRTMDAIVSLQRDYFLDGDDTELKPMVLRNVAEKTGLDISTISRVVNSKYIQTPFGIYPLKHFFSEGMSTDSGEEVSTREIKKILQQSVENEDKSQPLTDEELVDLLTSKGYKISRRTIAKYRSQLNIPIARMRREI